MQQEVQEATRVCERSWGAVKSFVQEAMRGHQSLLEIARGHKRLQQLPYDKRQERQQQLMIWKKLLTMSCTLNLTLSLYLQRSLPGQRKAAQLWEPVISSTAMMMLTPTWSSLGSGVGSSRRTMHFFW